MKPTYIQQIKAMASVMNPNANVLPEIKLYKSRKLRAKETKPRAQPEAEFRRDLIKYLRDNRCRVNRVEPFIRGTFGLGDLWVLCPRTRWGGWVEVKAPDEDLKPNQIIFRDLCILCRVNYITAWKIDDVKIIVDTHTNT